MQKRAKVNILKIINVLRAYQRMHVRGIAKIANMHPITVSSLVNRLEYFFNIENVEIIPGIKIKFISLKNPNLTVEDVEKYVKLRKSIKGEKYERNKELSRSNSISNKNSSRNEKK